MGAKLVRRGKGKIAQKGTAKKSLQEFVVVGNYKERQLAWIEKNGVYNYPVRDGDEYSEESMCAVKELWLFANVKSQRHAFAVKGYVGKLTKDEFLAKCPTYAKLGKMHHAAYYVFRMPTSLLRHAPDASGECTVALPRPHECTFKSARMHSPRASLTPGPFITALSDSRHDLLVARLLFQLQAPQARRFLIYSYLRGWETQTRVAV